MKTVLITGANKGIGFETARQLLQKGFFLYIGSRTIKNGLEAVQKLNAEGFSNVEAVELDGNTKSVLFNIIDTLLRDAKARKAYA